MRDSVHGLRVALAAVSVVVATGCTSGVANQALPTPTAETSPTPTPTATAVPSLDTGDGHDGDLVVRDSRVLNVCTPLEDSGAVTAEVASPAGIEVGDRLLLIQMQADFQAVSGMPGTITAAAGAGTFELIRVADVTGDVVRAEEPLSGSYGSGLAATAQACTVPQYENLTVTASGVIGSEPWDGTRGGIVALMVRDTLTLENRIATDGAGFRGGLVQPDHQGVNQEAEEYAAGEGGGKGESLDIKSYGLAGRGSLATAGGGGNGRDGGGGGGGNGGLGGFAGKQTQGQNNNANVRGRPGGAVAIAGALTLGAGGGAGHQSDTTGGAGANGGGIVFIVTDRFTGVGAVSANGARGLDSANDGAGGGGAGGSVWVQALRADWAGIVSANGGAGGDELDNGNRRGPGGGGGGGRLLVAGLPDAVLRTEGGANGVCPEFDDDPHSATPGQGGSVQLLRLE